MRKTLFIILGSVTAILVVALIIGIFKFGKDDKLLSVKEAHNYCINNEERQISIVLYFTDDTIYNNIDIINNVTISDKNEENMLGLKLINVKDTGYTYKHEKDKYKAYKYDLEIPAMNNDFIIDDAYIIIEANSKKIKANIGAFNVKYVSDLGKELYLSVNKLEGKCIYSPYQTLSYIDIELVNKTNSNITINTIKMGPEIYLSLDENDTFKVSSKKHVIGKTLIGYMSENYRFYLNYSKYLMLSKSYLEINYSDELGSHTCYIDTFNYYDNGYQIPEYNELLNIQTI